MLPMPETQGLGQQQPLDLHPMGAHRPRHGPDVEGGVRGIGRDVAHEVRHQHAARVGHDRARGEPSERALVEEPQLPLPEVEVRPGMAVRGSTSVVILPADVQRWPPGRGFHAELPAHAQVRGQDEVGVVGDQPEELAAPTGRR